MQQVLDRVERFAPSPVPILLLGETGTGKDRCAQIIWERSRAGGPLVSLNCAAIPETLIDSELFGHEQGAFTGAVRSRAGLVSQADGGTLFLDEIGELTPPTQAKLLRTMDTGEYRPVGSPRTLRATFRIIAAAQPDLDRAVAQSRFRADLLHRLGSVRIVMPPLRARREDIAPLAEAFLGHYRRRNAGSGPRSISTDAIALLTSARWPGNVRQLRNVVEAAAAAAGSRPRVEALDVLEFLPLEEAGSIGSLQVFPPLSERIRWAEDQAVLDALRWARGNRKEAARLLQVSEATFHRKLHALRERRGQALDLPSDHEEGRIEADQSFAFEDAASRDGVLPA